MRLTERLDPDARIAIAATCSAVAVLLTPYSDAEPSPRAFWLGVTLALYWRVSRGGVIAWRIACVSEAIGAAMFSLVAAGSWADPTSAARPVLLALLYLLAVATLTSPAVRVWVTRAPVRTEASRQARW